MEKQLAIKLLGGTPAKAARAMGYKSVQAVYMWPDVLTTDVADRVNGAVARIKLTRKSRITRGAEASAVKAVA